MEKVDNPDIIPVDVQESSTKIREEFYFKPEINAQIEDQTKRCIKQILRTVEIIMPDKHSNEFKHLRKAVLDAVNELKREIQTKLGKVL